MLDIPLEIKGDPLEIEGDPIKVTFIKKNEGVIYVKNIQVVEENKKTEDKQDTDYNKQTP